MIGRYQLSRRPVRPLTCFRDAVGTGERTDNGGMRDLGSRKPRWSDPRGIFIRLSPGGTTGSALSAGLGSLDAVFNPAAARAREEWDQQHERVVPVPSPGDRILDEGVIVIEVPRRDRRGRQPAQPVRETT